MTLGIMLQEIFIIQKRDHYLKRESSFKGLSIGLVKPPAAKPEEKKEVVAEKVEVKPVSK